MPIVTSSLALRMKHTSALNQTAVEHYVLGRRTAEGGYSYYRTPQWGVEEPNAPDTLAALECLRILAVEAPGRVRTERWLRGLQAHDGGYPTLTIGWAAVRALDVLGVEPSRSPRAWVQRRTQLMLGREGEREWRSVLVDSLHLLDLLSLSNMELEADERSALSEGVRAARDPAGGWARPGADLETSALAMRSMALVGLRCDDELEAFLRRCEDETLGLRFAPTSGMTSAGALWGGLELTRALGIAPSYPHAIAASLTLLQRPDGGLAARHRAIATLRDTWLGLSADELLQRTQEERA